MIFSHNFFQYLALVTLTCTSVVAKNKELQLKELSQSPYVVEVDNFLSDEECQYLIEISRPHLTRSEVVDLDKPGNYIDPRRTSEGFFLSENPHDPMLNQIEDKIVYLSNRPKNHGENLHILHYNVGGEYQPHYDYFDASTEGGRFCLQRGGQRLITVILYLNTTQAGGETVFPRLNIKVKPVKGKALMFYNCHAKGVIDPQTLHGGAPVLAGEKWIATRWIRERIFN